MDNKEITNVNDNQNIEKSNQPVMEQPVVNEQPVEIPSMKNDNTNNLTPENSDINQVAQPITDQPATPVAPTQQIVETQPVANEQIQPVSETTPTEQTQNVVPQQNSEETRKKKNDNFNSDEKIIYEMKQEVDGNPIIVILFLLGLFAFIFFLPIIADKTGGLIKLNQNKNKPVVTPSTPTNPEESKYFGFHDEAEIGDLRLSNLITTNIDGEYALSFTIVNNGKSIYTFNKKYYVLLYDNEKLIYRALIHSYEPIPSKGAIELKLLVNEKAYNEANKYSLEEIPEGKYPNRVMTQVEDEYDVLECTYQNDVIRYYFTDDELLKISETYKENNTNKYYSELITENYNNSVKFNSIEGFDSTFVEYPTNFILSNQLDLNMIQDNTLSSLKTYKFFSFRENVKTVAFEMEAQGYKCS